MKFWNASLPMLARDFLQAAGPLKRSPGFTVTAVLTLAIGIGASTAIFTILDSTILKPLSYRDSGKLVALWERIPYIPGEPVGPNPRHADLWRQHCRSFANTTLYRHGAIGVGTEHPQLVGTVLALPNLFDVLQVKPMLGRTFTDGDGVKGKDQVVVLTYGLWQKLFAGDTQAIGKSVRIGDVPREVIGVLPEGFHFPNRNALRSAPSKQAASNVPEPSVFVPAVLNLADFGWNGDYGNWISLARLKPGVSLEQAQAELSSTVSRIVEATPTGQRDNRPDWLQAFVQPMQEAMVGQSKTGLALLMAAVLSLMLIACLNLANAQLARTLARHREASVRMALGAPRWRLLWLSLAENLWLATVGAAAGVLLAGEALDLFRRYSPVDLPRLAEVQLNRTVLLFSAGLTIASTILFSLLPALSLLRTDPQASLQQGHSRALGMRASGALHSWLIGLQVCGCSALLLVTGLFGKNLVNLMRQEKGFATDQVAFAQVNLSGATYGPHESRVAFIDGVLERLRAIPGVRDAGYVSAMPLEGETWIEAMNRADQPKGDAPLINLRWASPGYFEATRHRLAAGRFFEERDRDLNSAVISEGEAKALFKDENPIGASVLAQGKKFTVIGVVGDSLNASLKAAPVKIAYLHFKNRTPAALFFMARGSQPTADSLAPAMREAIWGFAPQVAIVRAKTLNAQVNESLGSERFQTSVLMSFGAAALLLAMLGIHGVLSYAVASRRREFGLRAALGATRSRIYRHTFWRVGPPVLGGLAAGLAAGFFARRAIGQFLYGGAQAVDPAIMTLVGALLVTAAALAGYVPARQAASVEPMESLRAD